MDKRIWIAFGAASTACHGHGLPDDPAARGEFVPATDPTGWPFMGPVPEAIAAARGEGGYLAYEAAFGERIMPLADFVRDFPTAPLEALYRHARSHGVHDRPSDGWDDVPAAFRIAYAVFRATLMEADRVFAEEEARAAAKAAADKAQAPVMVRASETILEQHGTIFEKVGDPDVMVNLGGPVVAAGEGEGGDARGMVSEPPVAPAAQALDGAATAAAVEPVASPGHAADAADVDANAPPAAAAVDGNAEASAPAASGETAAAGQDGAVAAAPAPEAPRADALEAEAKAVSPARRKR